MFRAGQIVQCGRPHLHNSAMPMSFSSTPQAALMRHQSFAAHRRHWAATSSVFRRKGRTLQWNAHRPGRRQVSVTALFGVGAPEAVLVGVVALVVFGPKGLAEAVKSLGKTLKTFQPTIREVMSVSSELRNTLEEQIGLDDIRSELRSSLSSEPRADYRQSPTLEEPNNVEHSEKAEATSPAQLVEDSEAELERKRSAAAAAAWGGQPPAPPAEIDTVPQVEASSEPSHNQAAEHSGLEKMSLEDLEAELARRRGQQKREVSQ
ncbi:hypothetical protein CVIRNUC_002967 [Coccomyxa viridis]|uniref:Uncharacterized protein n=1 Tax=Coccomyxa viridis TaxID=1274662 RepID=A0AAV1HYD7_9CHLO|nr:hypothetical protein CVIRNUC_002967 [Coccomyxa viridis]